MSVVALRVEKDKIRIASDSIRVYGTTQEKDKAAKLIKVNELIAAHSGQARDIQYMSIFAQNHTPKDATEDYILQFMVEFVDWCKKRDPAYNMNSDFFFVYKGKAFLVCSDYFIREIPDYYAIGAGADYALSALYLGSDVEKAVETACELSIYCEQPINVLEAKK